MRADLNLLSPIKSNTGAPTTEGLSEDRLAPFLADENLSHAITMAVSRFNKLSAAEKTILQGSEREAISTLQADFLNFYSPGSVSPYVPLAAKGPWIVTAYGSVIYDTGGYGMLGFGHNPDFVTDPLAKSYVMANIMTASIEQHRFAQCLKAEVGHSRSSVCPYYKFLCMNSGSESMSVATRISDLHAAKQTGPGGKWENANIKILSHHGSFHGRTGRPGRASNSSLKSYKQLASYRNYDGTLLVRPNDIDDLKRVFSAAEKANQFIEFMVIEPVMGEGNPGLAITPEYYAAARQITKEHGSLLIVDSIQSGLRAQGVLSIVDYPGFETLDAPDIESYSKAVNAGQLPVSVLALSKEIAEQYVPGIYGNTMTANPRALELTVAVLNQVTSELRNNIRIKGREFLSELNDLSKASGGKITKVQGTGLLISCELESGMAAFGFGSIEELMRFKGVNVIHGGVNSLRFTPHFNITSAEIKLILDVLDEAIS